MNQWLPSLIQIVIVRDERDEYQHVSWLPIPNNAIRIDMQASCNSTRALSSRSQTPLGVTSAQLQWFDGSVPISQGYPQHPTGMRWHEPCFIANATVRFVFLQVLWIVFSETLIPFESVVDTFFGDFVRSGDSTVSPCFSRYSIIQLLKLFGGFQHFLRFVSPSSIRKPAISIYFCGWSTSNSL